MDLSRYACEVCGAKSLKKVWRSTYYDVVVCEKCRAVYHLTFELNFVQKSGGESFLRGIGKIQSDKIAGRQFTTLWDVFDKSMS